MGRSPRLQDIERREDLLDVRLNVGMQRVSLDRQRPQSFARPVHGGDTRTRDGNHEPNVPVLVRTGSQAAPVTP
ncbi:hypothetical protein MOKP4_35740 [Mycobacterium avium subsp. hominissuis]